MEKASIVRHIKDIYEHLLKRLPFLYFLKHTPIKRICNVSRYILINDGTIYVTEHLIIIGTHTFAIKPEDYGDITRIKNLITQLNT